jgi:hypothetical protein
MTAARGEVTPIPLQLIAPQDDDRVAALQQRAEHLRCAAMTMHSLVAQAYRRRASELELEAWLWTMRSGAADAAA